MARGVAVSQDLHQAIVNMHSLGVPNAQLVRYTGVPLRTIQNILHRFNQHGDVGGSGKSSGRRCILSSDDIKVRIVYIYLIFC